MDDFKTKILVLALMIFTARAVATYVYDPTLYRAEWYSVRTPPGWERKLEDDEVFFRSPAKDYLGNPEAIFSIYGYKSKGALFMDMFFPDVLENLAKQNGKLLQQGEIKIDDIISNWTLFRYNEPKWIIWTFYVIDDFNRLTKIQMMAKPEHFDKYRSTFESFKDTIKFKKIF